MCDIDKAMEFSGSKEEFIQAMSVMGYSVIWTDDRKYITYQCPNKMKCRDIKLHEDKYLKGNIENEFRYRQLNSLNNQRNILVEYAKANNHDIVGESFDDNVSGMYFNREGINKIYEEVEKKSFETILVKDMSRLGRHKTQTAMFIDYLRENDINVLSVTENLDTSNESDDLIIGFKGLFNDMYDRDISKKVRAGMNQKLKDGMVLTPPMGYFKDKKTNEIVVVEEHAEIVRRIFDMYLNGYGFNSIAKILNQEGVKSPAYYQKKLFGKNLGYNKPEIGRRYLWDNTGVKKILQNEFYIGTVVNHKTYNNKITHIRKKFLRTNNTDTKKLYLPSSQKTNGNRYNL